MDKTRIDSVNPTTQDQDVRTSAEPVARKTLLGAGSCMKLICEVSRLSHALDSEMPVEWMIKRTQFFAYELTSVLPEGLDERGRLAFLNRFFFDQKRFKCMSEMSKLPRPADAFRMSRVLTARAGAPIVLALIYGFLAERIDVSLEFVDFNPAWFLKWNDQGRSRYIDVTRSGATLSFDELIEVLQTRYAVRMKIASLLEPLTFERFLVEFVCDLKSTLTGSDLETEKMLILQNALIDYQPANLQLLPERATLYRKLGLFKKALADLKRFFAFNDRERASADTVRLHEELVGLVAASSDRPTSPDP